VSESVRLRYQAHQTGSCNCSAYKVSVKETGLTMAVCLAVETCVFTKVDKLPSVVNESYGGEKN
jgi:hypothetical protein